MNNIQKNAEASMNKAMEHLDRSLSSIRAGRANPGILNPVVVDYYGTPTPISQMAAVSVAENRILVIQPWDKSTIGEIEKALHKADLGIAPTNDGTVIRLVFPQPTEERRKEINKEVRSTGEEAKVAVRNIRRDANNELKKLADSASEDDIVKMEKEVQELTDKFTKKIDETISAKEKEVLEI